MDKIELKNALPEVFALRDDIQSEIWHREVTFERGHLYLVEAGSGTGKSSLCSYIIGYRNDYQGIISFDGKNIRNYKVKDWVELRKRSLSHLFQELRLFPELTAYENVAIKNNLTGFKKKKQIEAWFDALGIGDKLHAPISRMSFGQQQRVAIARALALHPDILCFDEPTSALDPELTGEVLSVMRQLAEEGMTMLVVTHEMGFARNVSSKTVFMENGVVVEQAPSQQFFASPKEERTRAFLRRIAHTE